MTERKFKGTHIIAFIDASGSMGGWEGDVCRGFNTFLDDQRNVLIDAAKITLVFFDNSHRIIYDFEDVQNVPKLTIRNYRVRGSTEIYKTVQYILDHNTVLAKRTMCLILTDGGDNGYHSPNQVKKMIQQRIDTGLWEFVFLAVGHDASQCARDLGIPMENAINLAGSAQGIKDAYQKMSKLSSDYRTKKNK